MVLVVFGSVLHPYIPSLFLTQSCDQDAFSLERVIEVDATFFSAGSANVTLSLRHTGEGENVPLQALGGMACAALVLCLLFTKV